MSFLEDEKTSYLLHGLLLLLLLLNLSLHVYEFFSFADKEESSSFPFINEEEMDTAIEEEEVEVSEESKMVKVDIKGAVKKPGVYTLTENSIIQDVIQMAGGLKSNASTQYLNLSKKINNEMVIYIYTTTQVNKMSSPSTDTCVANGADTRSCEGASIIVSGTTDVSSSESTVKKESNEKISINTASLEELMRLSGIGEAKAAAIIAYRDENGGFKTLEELMNVSGIGEAAYNKIKDNITL